MAVDGTYFIEGGRCAKREEGEEPVSKTKAKQIQPGRWRMSGLTQDGTAEPVLSRETK